MFEINAAFIAWMRTRLRDRDYAQRVLRAVTEIEDARLEDTWLHAALPPECKIEADPEAMIALLKGYNVQKKEYFHVVLFGKWEDVEDLAIAYPGFIWGMYDPRTDLDLEKLPAVYEVAFQDIDSDQPIGRIRWTATTEYEEPATEEAADDTEEDEDSTEDETSLFGFDKHKINLINTHIDSHIMEIILGGE